MDEAIHEAARRLRNDVLQDIVDPNVAIAFVVSTERDWDFGSFYEWFEEYEDTFHDDFVTLAPFHPEWQFGGAQPELDVEKQSPYPTVTIVCSSVIDKAGAAATERIGAHNEDVLLYMGLSKLQRLYQMKVLQKEPPS